MHKNKTRSCCHIGRLEAVRTWPPLDSQVACKETRSMGFRSCHLPMSSAIFQGYNFTPCVTSELQGTQKSRMVSSKDKRMIAKSNMFHHFSLPQKKLLIPFANKPEAVGQIHRKKAGCWWFEFQDDCTSRQQKV